jgi:hypothetical protein
LEAIIPLSNMQHVINPKLTNTTISIDGCR